MNNFLTLILLFSISSISQEKEIINPSKEIGLSQWRIVNDNVMGGVSNSDLYLNKEKNLIFSGEISLDYNGGFASCRHSLVDINLEGIKSFKMRIKGDGKTYKLRLNQRNRSVNYSSNFQTKKDTWMNIEIFIEDLVPTFMGYYSRSSPKIKIEKINSIGFLISDKQEGKFSLEIKNVKAIK